MRVIAGCARGRTLKTRKGMDTRPTADRVKESLFNILTPYLAGAEMLDVFAGNGGVGIEALSRGADRCVFVEKNAQCAKIIKDNLILTGLADRGEILPRDALGALSLLQKRDNRFNIIFLDPPYHSPELADVLRKIAQCCLLLPDGLLLVEHHSADFSWHDPEIWNISREKKYGDTTISFLSPAAAGGDVSMSQQEEDK
ncbi:16S rRNA (guanine(966)-N(2))-methyltransferase RsmD [Dethiobacter alkaliphilus]|uniref:16S rRNA (guanine(966)-N(2))-methyltransferase RsmD n=1 Tax=Dethiobacter alkaliphilus TaxID=427926 RepID=UPI0022278F5C|nr:16S rRNA (guanine(966)-N(2))-methyltransferase RsmD [Dethiobacter alkaliphilus]MCW3489921.1 16S rRNA (guanine(966)-N(2))-methyltransferase RsmD [Dethiobacter alkaliphilus]